VTASVDVAPAHCDNSQRQ